MRKLLLSLLVLPLSATAFCASVSDDTYAPGDREAAYTDNPGAVAEVQAMADVSLLLMALSQDNMDVAYNVALDGYYNAVAAAQGGADTNVMWELAATFYGFLDTGEYTFNGFTFDTDGATWSGSDGLEYTMSYEEFGPWLAAVTRRPDFDVPDGDGVPGGDNDPWGDHGPGEGGGDSGGSSDSGASFGDPNDLGDPLGLDGSGYPGSRRPNNDNSHDYGEYDWGY